MMQEYIDTLPKGKKFFTVVQYDDGLMVDFPNCLVFSAGGKPDDAIPIPLLCDPHKINGEVKKDIPISMICNQDTHPIRKQIAKAMYGKEYCYIARHYGDKYVDTIRRSYFTICPRGYGKTSFRLYEAIQLGTIPVYISDSHWLPFQDHYVDWYQFCPMSNNGRIDGLLTALYMITQNKKRYYDMYKDMDHYKKYFTYDSVAMYIRREVEYN